jgi:SM-20-related protein
MSAGEPLDVLRRVTGNQDVAFADAQLTAYGPGDFLTLHDDAAPATKRTAAYVFGLTKDWRADWGGALLFHDAANLVGWAPQFNVLNLFAVPQPHSVSLVSAAAAGRRFSVSGWLRRI